MAIKAEILLESTHKLFIEFFEENAPNTVKNFCTLAERGFYDGLIFHKVIPHFVVQTGCPKGDGTGNAGYHIKCELNGGRQNHEEGVLSMAHCGRDTASSQFFICLNTRNTQHLNGNHTCFGRVTRGMQWLNDIKKGDQIRYIKIIREESK